MKITMYELLGMVKDGKIPKKIKYDGKLYEFDESKDNYYENETCSINWDYVAIYCLNETVEILEEPKGIPEKLDHLIGYDIQQFDDLKEYVEITTNDLFGKVNKIIDTLNQRLS